MAGIGTAVTLLDWSKVQGPDGSIQAIAEVLGQKNEFIEDMVWVEGNLPTGHRGTIRTGLPTVYFRLLNQGVPPSKATTTQVDEAAAIMEARCQIDKDLAELNGLAPAFRASQSVPFLESMAQTFAAKAFYGNVNTDPEQFSGLATRYSDNTTAAIKENIIDGGGTGSDNTSIWLIGWGDNAVHGIYPKGSQMCLQHQDLGLADAFDSNGYRFRAYLDWYQWKAGLFVADWRCAVRIPNIDVSNTVGATSAPDIASLMIQAIDKVNMNAASKWAFYMNRTLGTALNLQMYNRPNMLLTMENSDGKAWSRFRGIPIRTVDQILSTESRVT